MRNTSSSNMAVSLLGRLLLPRVANGSRKSEPVRFRAVEPPLTTLTPENIDGGGGVEGDVLAEDELLVIAIAHSSYWYWRWWWW